MSIGIYITGTNCTGKTTVAKLLIEYYGGVKSTSREITVCNAEDVCFIGRYEPDKKICGVDCLGNTKELEQIFHDASKRYRLIYAEGAYLHTFGNNLTRAIFQCDQQYVFYLYSTNRDIIARQRIRTPGKKVNYVAMLAKQKAAMRSAVKWKDAGATVWAFNSSLMSPTEIVNQIIARVK